MTTRIFPPHDINGIRQPEFPYKSPKSYSTKRRASAKHSKKTIKVVSKSDDKIILELKNSLRQECLRLASFLRQESFRPGYVR